MDRPISLRYFETLKLHHSTERPVYLQLADIIMGLIKSGKLQAGQKLPATRDMSQMLKINRITVSKAYEELQLQGWLQSAVGRGTFISSHIGDSPKMLGKNRLSTPSEKAGFTIRTVNYPDAVKDTPPARLHLDDGFPDPRLAPLKEFYWAYRNQLTRSGLYYKFGSYGNPAGPLQYREALSRYLNDTRALKTTSENILSVRGTLMGINLVSNTLIAPGDIIVSGVPGWKRAEHNFIHAGAKHIGIPVDENGLVVEELKKICKKKPVRMVYVTPHHHYPTTVSLRIDRRLELLKLAHQYGFIIFEDDYDFDFHYKLRPLLPLASADENGMVIYCGSFSKSFSPAFRMGYLVAAKNVIEHLARQRILLDRQGDHILDIAMGDLLNDGTIQRYIRKTLPIYEERRNHFCDLLQSQLKSTVDFSIPEGGMTVWTKFPKSINLETLARKALQKGLFISDGKPHQYPHLDANAIRLGFASSLPDELSESIAILKKLI